jgi:hypothetical protein
VAQAADGLVAWEEIARYYQGRFDAAREVYASAAESLAAATRSLGLWRQNCVLTASQSGDGHDSQPRVRVEVLLIVAEVRDRYQVAARAAVEHPGDAELLDAAQVLHGRLGALCRWLSSQGHNLGDVGGMP